MSLLSAQSSVLVLVDYQSRLMPTIDEHPTVLARAQLLADVARIIGVRTVGTEQNPQGLGRNDVALRARCEETLSKMHFDACEDGLLEALSRGDPSATHDVVIAGCEAHVCLLQTGLGLIGAGRRLWVVSDACGSRRASSHRLAMQRLATAGATLVDAEMVVFEWLRSCEHAQFRDVLQRLKAAGTSAGHASP